MNEKFKKALEDQKIERYKTTQICNENEKLKLIMTEKIEEIKSKIENDFLEFTEFLIQAEFNHAIFEYLLPDTDHNIIPYGRNHYCTSIFILIDPDKISLGLEKNNEIPCFQYIYKEQISKWDSSIDLTMVNCTLYICTHWKQIQVFLEDKMIEYITNRNAEHKQAALRENKIITSRLEILKQAEEH